MRDAGEAAVKYLCLIYVDEDGLRKLAQGTVEAIANECIRHAGSLREGGTLVAMERLEPAATAATVRPQDGCMAVTDGPFAGSREKLAGFCLIEARDMNAAIRIALRIPPGRLGCVEVRPVRE